jgi:hypothetical protein
VVLHCDTAVDEKDACFLARCHDDAGVRLALEAELDQSCKRVKGLREQGRFLAPNETLKTVGIHQAYELKIASS